MIWCPHRQLSSRNVPAAARVLPFGQRLPSTSTAVQHQEQTACEITPFHEAWNLGMLTC